MRTYALAGSIALIAVILGSQAQGADVNLLPPNDPMTWLVKSVCVDSQDQPLAIDPYDSIHCPAIRKIKVGDPLPYHNIEQIGYQQRDAFPVSNPVDGKTWIINTFDYRGYEGNIIDQLKSFNFFNLYATEDRQSDGYDVIALQDNVVAAQDRWATIVNTSDGGGYEQTFYGSNCRVGDGWVLFPATGFLAGGQIKVTMADVYWEQSDQNYPGNCPASYPTPPLTSWQCIGTTCSPPQPDGFDFGGVTTPTKIMDTVISYHGFKSGGENLEVFYFTREYGMTRWEVWVPKLSNPSAIPTTECMVPATEIYRGVTYVVTNCHDWSNVVSPATAVPVWPVPNVNILSNPHFISTTIPWKKLGGISATPMISQSVRDKLLGGIGVGYLRLSCPRCGTSGKNDPFSNALYQDLPAAECVDSGNYAFGISVRTDPNQCPAPCSGKIAVVIQQFDAHGKTPLAVTSATATVASDNGTSDPSDEEAKSVYLSTAFFSGAMNKNPRAATIRFLISPQSAQTFDVLNAWFAAWPASLPAQTAVTSATTIAPAGRAMPEMTPPSAENLLVAHPSEESLIPVH